MALLYMLPFLIVAFFTIRAFINNGISKSVVIGIIVFTILGIAGNIMVLEDAKMKMDKIIAEQRQ